MSMSLKASKGQLYGSGVAGGPLSGHSAGMYSRRAYMGDPGLFGFLGKAAGGLLRTAGKLLPGPAGIAAGAIGGAIAGGGGGIPAPGGLVYSKTPGLAGPLQQRPTPMLPVPGVGGAVQRFLPGGRTGYMPASASEMKAPSGYHWNKTDYFLKDGTFVPKGTKLVKNRRRNPLNPKAASRAISRLESAKKATKRLDRISIKCKRCGCSRCKC